MSDSEDSTVTYIAVSSPFADLPNIRSSGVDGPPVMPEDPYAYMVAAFQALPSPDYLSGPEYPPSPGFVLKPVYPEFMLPEDEVFPVEEQPLPTAASSIDDSPGHVLESDPKEDPEEDDDEDPKEDPVDYPIDGGDDGDDEDESSDDDEDDDVDIEEDEHPALADSTVVDLLAVDQAPSTEETEPLKLADIPEVTLPPRKRLGIALGPRYKVGKSSSSPTTRPPGGAPVTDDTELGRRMIEFTTRVRQDTDEIYTSSRPQETGGDYRDVGGTTVGAGAVLEASESCFKEVVFYQNLKWLTHFEGNLFVLICVELKTDESAKVYDLPYDATTTFAITSRSYVIVLSVSFHRLIRILSREGVSTSTYILSDISSTSCG
ncbi:hypothetical protein Tco_1320618 [Tanacetum coccineum]